MSVLVARIYQDLVQIVVVPATSAAVIEERDDMTGSQAEPGPKPPDIQRAREATRD